ncbi:MAG: hypothetical protein GY822_03145 [Deltaproteobacteria bacterium]|nr:hypothetical protein [Deltaproteobacteria bacterium]
MHYLKTQGNSPAKRTSLENCQLVLGSIVGHLVTKDSLLQYETDKNRLRLKKRISVPTQVAA